MKKWAIAAFLYVFAVIGGYQIYDKWIANEKSSAARTEGQMDQMGMGTDHSKDSSNHGNDSGNMTGSEVNAFVQTDQSNIKIFLKDKAGNLIEDLEVNHEKLMHFIIVDDHLEKYYHLHPEKTGKGEFSIGNDLPDGFYKAYIDIKPKNEEYMVEPIPFVEGNPNPDTKGNALTPDNSLNKTVDGENVKLRMSSFKSGEPVTLSFILDQSNLTPYLGAMGHVVIVDEYGKKYIHVHPANEHDPVFETEFEKPGIYKIWAEFQQNGIVRAFPFVIKIKE